MKTAVQKCSSPVELAFDRYVCYPTEKVVLFLRYHDHPKSGEVIFVKLPGMTEPEFSSEEASLWRVLKKNDSEMIVYCRVPEGDLDVFDTSLPIRLNTLFMNHYLMFSVWVENQIPKSLVIPSTVSQLRLTVMGQAKYLNYLPELYSYDDFMNRFLMFFESFWKPISTQIGQNENIFDPSLTPDAFVPWLASWIGLDIDDSFPEDRKRKLVKSAISFYHSRGTLGSLKQFLEMYSGGDVRIRELKAKNLVLGKEAKLGEGIALGRQNQPNTVMIKVTTTKYELTRTGFSSEVYTQKVCELIRKIVPAHTVFTLECAFK